MRISDWSSDVCSSDLSFRLSLFAQAASAMTSQMADLLRVAPTRTQPGAIVDRLEPGVDRLTAGVDALLSESVRRQWDMLSQQLLDAGAPEALTAAVVRLFKRSEEHTSELQSLMRISSAVFCLKKK